MISRVLGFARDMVFAHIFGAHGSFDAFVVAFKIPNFLRRLFAEGAFSQAFVPVLAEYQRQQSPDEVKLFISRIAGSLALALFIVTILAEIAAPLLVIASAPGFLHDPQRYAEALHMLRITFPYLMLISLSAFCGAVLNSFGVFSVPAFTPVFLNLALISAAVWLAPMFDISVHALAWGVLIGGIAQFTFQLPFLGFKGLLPRPRLELKDKGVHKVLRLMLPAIFGVSVAQISLFIDTLFASYLTEGSISWLYYSQQLTFFPLGVFGVALSTVVLPHLSREHASNNRENYMAALDWALRCVLVIAIPATIGLGLMSGPLLTALFQSGKFSPNDVRLAQQSLLAFSVGLTGFMLVKIFASAFYSRQDINTPVRIAVLSLIANIGLNLVLIFPLKHAGLALATALSSSLNAVLLFRKLIQENIYQPLPGWKNYLIKLTFASVAMAAFIIVLVPSLDHWLQWGRWYRAVQIILWVLAAVTVYLFGLWLTGMRLRDFKLETAQEG